MKTNALKIVTILVSTLLSTGLLAGNDDEFVDAIDELELAFEQKSIDGVMAKNILYSVLDTYKGVKSATTLVFKLSHEKDPKVVISQLASFVEQYASDQKNILSEEQRILGLVIQSVRQNLLDVKRSPSGNLDIASTELEDGWELIDVGRSVDKIPQRLVFRDGHDLNVHPVLTADTYNDLLVISDLSYKVAAEFRIKDQSENYRKMRESLLEQLTRGGWKLNAEINGKTGFNNANPDITAIVLSNPTRNLVAVAFHGSISSDYSQAQGFFSKHLGQNGDWAANWDSVSVNANKLGIWNAPLDVMIHRGFGNNYVSARRELLFEVGNAALKLKRENGKTPVTFVVGHSKGAAMASIAVADIKTHLNAALGEDSHVAAILLSAPKAMEISGRHWVSKVVGTGNVLRINVWADPATKQSALGFDWWWLGTRKLASVGVLVLDDIGLVRKRTEAKHYRLKGPTSLIQWVAGYHYGAFSPECGDYVFSPKVVMTFEELPFGIEKGAKQQISTDSTSLLNTVFAGSEIIEKVNLLGKKEKEK